MGGLGKYGGRHPGLLDESRGSSGFSAAALTTVTADLTKETTKKNVAGICFPYLLPPLRDFLVKINSISPLQRIVSLVRLTHLCICLGQDRYKHVMETFQYILENSTKLRVLILFDVGVGGYLDYGPPAWRDARLVKMSWTEDALISIPFDDTWEDWQRILAGEPHLWTNVTEALVASKRNIR